MHRTCIGPTCTVTFEACMIHHLTPWHKGGATDLANIAPLTLSHELVAAEAA
jgi:hypothetical protein